MDYRAIAAKELTKLSTPDLLRFLIVCSLASDLYCPGYNPRETLAKDSNLARTALRYKVDTAKLADTIRDELKKKTAKGGSPKTKGKVGA